MPGTKSRRRSSGLASARHDASVHESDAIPLAVQVPTPDGHSRDDGHHEATAMTITSDPVPLISKVEGVGKRVGVTT